MFRLLIVALCLLSVPAHADPFRDQVAAVFAEAGPGTRWGVVVADDTGREVLAIDPEGRFIPASTAKIVTTAAAFWASSGTLDLPGGGASVAIRGDRVILAGHGDARLSSAPDCRSDCLDELADRIAAATHTVGTLIGDDTAFAAERWGPGMSWNNLATRSGTAATALTLDDNEIAATVAPGASGAAPTITFPLAPGYFRVRNLATSADGSGEAIALDRLPGSRELILSGTIGTGAKPLNLHLGLDDPADYAAWRLAALLRARGVSVRESHAEHRLPGTMPAPAPVALAALIPPPLAEDLALTAKQSQNLHAELLLRRLGLLHGTGTIADGLAVTQAMLAAAGVPPQQVSLVDGSGMSSYDRIAPRGMVRLLGWIARQGWGAAWLATLPIGGIDGTLAHRFTGELDGKVMAKTGTLNASSGLAGAVMAHSGHVLRFAIYANDMPEGVAVNPLIDRALALVAAAE
jgi:D-alanyl-D-alanine carboxypeptidase/D-alanyl-D-alanine-endopeptidase (penicillin-binding protein 4)